MRRTWRVPDDAFVRCKDVYRPGQSDGFAGLLPSVDALSACARGEPVVARRTDGFARSRRTEPPWVPPMDRKPKRPVKPPEEPLPPPPEELAPVRTPPGRPRDLVPDATPPSLPSEPPSAKRLESKAYFLEPECSPRTSKRGTVTDKRASVGDSPGRRASTRPRHLSITVQAGGELPVRPVVKAAILAFGDSLASLFDSHEDAYRFFDADGKKSVAFSDFCEALFRMHLPEEVFVPLTRRQLFDELGGNELRLLPLHFEAQLKPSFQTARRKRLDAFGMGIARRDTLEEYHGWCESGVASARQHGVGLTAELLGPASLSAEEAHAYVKALRSGKGPVHHDLGTIDITNSAKRIKGTLKDLQKQRRLFQQLVLAPLREVTLPVRLPDLEPPEKVIRLGRRAGVCYADVRALYSVFVSCSKMTGRHLSEMVMDFPGFHRLLVEIHQFQVSTATAFAAWLQAREQRQRQAVTTVDPSWFGAGLTKPGPGANPWAFADGVHSVMSGTITFENFLRWFGSL